MSQFDGMTTEQIRQHYEWLQAKAAAESMQYGLARAASLGMTPGTQMFGDAYNRGQGSGAQFERNRAVEPPPFPGTRTVVANPSYPRAGGGGGIAPRPLGGGYQRGYRGYRGRGPSPTPNQDRRFEEIQAKRFAGTMGARMRRSERNEKALASLKAFTPDDTDADRIWQTPIPGMTLPIAPADNADADRIWNSPVPNMPAIPQLTTPVGTPSTMQEGWQPGAFQKTPLQEYLEAQENARHPVRQPVMGDTPPIAMGPSAEKPRPIVWPDEYPSVTTRPPTREERLRAQRSKPRAKPRKQVQLTREQLDAWIELQRQQNEAQQINFGY